MGKRSLHRLPTPMLGAVLAFSFLILAFAVLASGSHAKAAALHNTGNVPAPVATQTTPLPTQSATAVARTATRTNTPFGTSTPTPIGWNPTATNTPPVPPPPPTAPPTLCPLNFTDVSQGDWFYPYVSYLYCRGSISGYSDSTFRPYNNTTRGQLSKIIVLAEGWSLNTAGGPHFSDVALDNPFYSYIETAYNRGVISGYSDGTFRWGNNITRGQLSKIVVLAAGWALTTTGGPHFSDVPADNPFYAYVETASFKGAVSGYSDGTFRPGANATRAQLSKIVQIALVTH